MTQCIYNATTTTTATTIIIIETWPEKQNKVYSTILIIRQLRNNSVHGKYKTRGVLLIHFRNKISKSFYIKNQTKLKQTITEQSKAKLSKAKQTETQVKI